jgi:hypothetical protein
MDAFDKCIMHNYVDLNYLDKIPTPDDYHDYKVSNKISQDLTAEKARRQRDSELQHLGGGKRPVI